MVHAVVLRVGTVKSNTVKGYKNQKIHEAVDMAITEAISEYAHTENVHADINGHDLAQNTEKSVE